MIKVSVIIPIYNNAKYLSQCIESLINQSLKDVEFIFIDDGSVDNSVEIVEKYIEKDNRISLFKQSHKNQGASRNLGIKKANGEYIAFVDSDDWVDIDFLEVLYKSAKSNDSDIVACSFVYYDKNKKRFKNEFNYRDFPLKIIEGCYVKNIPECFFDMQTSVCNKIFKTDFIKKNNFYFNEKLFFEDFDFFAQTWVKQAKVSFVREYKYFYRIESDNSTYYKNDLSKFDIFKIIDMVKNNFEKNGILNHIKKDFDTYCDRAIVHGLSLINNFLIKFFYFLYMLFKKPKHFCVFMKIILGKVLIKKP